MQHPLILLLGHCSHFLGEDDVVATYSWYALATTSQIYLDYSLTIAIE
jgi:hypothetical protein